MEETKTKKEKGKFMDFVENPNTFIKIGRAHV